MLAAAAVCPHPPLLVPTVVGGAAAEVAVLLAACDAAVARLLATGPDAVVVVGTGPVAGAAAPTAVGSLAGYGVAMRVALGTRPLPAAAAPPDPVATLPLSVTVGTWLVRRAGWTGEVLAHVVSEATTPAEAAAVGVRLAAGPGRAALLVAGDGSARHEPASPGRPDPRARPWDDRIARALGAADATALAALDPAEARDLLAAGRAPWQVLAGAAGAGRWDADLLHTSAPYGVGYHVAVWTPA